MTTWQKDVDLSHGHLSIHAITSRLSTTLKYQLSCTKIPWGRISQKCRQQDQESSQNQVYKSELHSSSSMSLKSRGGGGQERERKRTGERDYPKLNNLTKI